jgi:hypothetical protein
MITVACTGGSFPTTDDRQTDDCFMSWACLGIGVAGFSFWWFNVDNGGCGR